MVSIPPLYAEKIHPHRRSLVGRILWITHGHWDHTQGAAEVVRATGAKVRAHPADRAMIETPEAMERFMGEKLGLEPVRVDHWVAQGERFSALGRPVEVRHVPGHCPGNVLFYFPESESSMGILPMSEGQGVRPGPAQTHGRDARATAEAPTRWHGGVAFVGDALFNGSIGRTDLPGGDFPTLEKSIRHQIYSLPEATVIYPGHGWETTVGHEKKHNPYVHS